MRKRYKSFSLEEADVIVALGGDGFLLSVLHQHFQHHTPIFGLNRGTVGFLMNEYSSENLMERLADAQLSLISPLVMTATDVYGHQQTSMAFNEVSVFREKRQAAHVSLTVDGQERMDQLICDGVLLATPAGSTAYNLSANGPVIPLDAGLLALTPISAFRPRRWKGALLPSTCSVSMKNLDPSKRPISATSDFVEVREVECLDVVCDPSVRVPLLFDPHSSLDERMLREQFLQ